MKLNRRIPLITISVLFVALLISSVVTISNFRKTYTEALVTGSLGLGQSLNSVIQELLDLGLPLESLAGMDKKLKQVVQNNPHISYATIVDLTGRVVFHSDAAQVGQSSTDQWMKKSITTSAALTQTYQRFDGHVYHDLTLPIVDSNQVRVGIIRLGFRVEVVNDKVREAITHVAINVTLTFVVIALLINYLLSRLVSKPVTALADLARKIAQGQFDCAMPVQRNDEIGLLSGSLHAMAATLKAQIEALQHASGKLEHQVAQRTLELDIVNHDLLEKNRVLVDVIAQKDALAAELLRSNAELEQFSYSISHDMRQPLRMISSYLQLLQRGLGDTLDAEKREHFDFAIDGAKRMDAMMMGLLEYSRVGRRGEPPVWLESRAVLDEALLFLRPLIAEAQAELHIDGEWPRLFASPDEMLRLLQNLVGNALKFRVADRVPQISLTGTCTGKHWHLCVADNGVGMAPDQMGRLFQVFQRLQSRAAFEGNGIGLALCRKIAEHHGGSIRADSGGEGLGSRFTLSLPLAAQAAPATSTAGPPA
jgi:signal transduction histidine kinase